VILIWTLWKITQVLKYSWIF